jgi:hypothetical protein
LEIEAISLLGLEIVLDDSVLEGACTIRNNRRASTEKLIDDFSGLEHKRH